MSKKHTLGPWNQVETSIWRDQARIAQCSQGPASKIQLSIQQNVDNARLIAAAPDLLEAAEMMLDAESFGPEHLDALRAAVDKARGND